MTSPEQNALFSDSVIREMFCGDISPNGSAIFDTPDLQALQAHTDVLTDGFVATLTDEQRALFTQFENARADERAARESATFLYAFKLGARLMREVLSDPHT